MKPPEPKDYIFAQEQRESAVINRLFALGGPLLDPWFEQELSWSMPYVWLGLRIPHERLLKGFRRAPNKFEGDIDVFGASLKPTTEDEYQRYRAEEEPHFAGAAPGRLENHVINRMIWEGKTKWPPDLSYIAAAEVKAAYYDASGVLKGAGGKKNGVYQARELCKMGFDRVALARFVVTEPVDVPGYHLWAVAGARSSEAMDEYLEEPKRIRVADDDPYGTALISGGSVPGKLEHHAGSSTGKWLKKPPENPYKEQAADIRKVIEENLFGVMSKYPVPRSAPVLILACSDNICGHLYVTGMYLDFITGEDSLPQCPNCGKSPR